MAVAAVSGSLWVSATSIEEPPGWVDALSSILIAGVTVEGVSLVILRTIRRATSGR